MGKKSEEIKKRIEEAERRKKVHKMRQRESSDAQKGRRKKVEKKEFQKMYDKYQKNEIEPQRFRRVFKKMRLNTDEAILEIAKYHAEKKDKKSLAKFARYASKNSKKLFGKDESASRIKEGARENLSEEELDKIRAFKQKKESKPWYS